MSNRENLPYEAPTSGYPGVSFSGLGGFGNVPYANLSPYAYGNVDPSIFRNTEPQYILPEGASQRRGRFEMAFSQIGYAVGAGAILGGVNGFYSGMRDASLKVQPWSVRKTQMINYVTKQGAASARTLGVLALMYSGFGVLISYTRGADDELNTLVAGTATGLLYKSSAGPRRIAMGGAVGFGIAAAYCLVMMSVGDRLMSVSQRLRF